jgi:ElaA protein
VRAGDAPSMEWYSFGDLSPALLYEVLRFRQAIFVVEQGCAFPDLDGRDQGARHLLLRVDGELAGYLRLIPFTDELRVAIGRVAVGEPFRGRGFARLLMMEALARCRRECPDCAVTLTGQTYLAPFYGSLRFAVTSAPYDDYGLSHVDMTLRVDARHPGTAEGRTRDP